MAVSTADAAGADPDAVAENLAWPSQTPQPVLRRRNPDTKKVAKTTAVSEAYGDNQHSLASASVPLRKSPIRRKKRLVSIVEAHTLIVGKKNIGSAVATSTDATDSQTYAAYGQDDSTFVDVLSSIESPSSDAMDVDTKFDARDIQPFSNSYPTSSIKGNFVTTKTSRTRRDKGKVPALAIPSTTPIDGMSSITPLQPYQANWTQQSPKNCPPR
jgi:hypothetical protein